MTAVGAEASGWDTHTHTDVGLTPPLTFSGEDLVDDDDDDRYQKR